MKKKAVALMLSAVMVMGMASAVSVQAGVADKTLIVGFDAEYPPYGYMDESGEYTGFDLELAQAVCDLEGWELEKKPINWDSKDMELNSGSIDCIWNGFTMNGREDDYTFSEPYVDNSLVIVFAVFSGRSASRSSAFTVSGFCSSSASLKKFNWPGISRFLFSLEVPNSFLRRRSNSSFRLSRSWVRDSSRLLAASTVG